MTSGRNNRAWWAVVAGLLAGFCVQADDHGDSIGLATALGTNSSAHAGVINTDIDKDWFSFNLLPWVGYAITITTNTLWDSDVELFAADGTTRLWTTNSAGLSVPLTIVWSNSGAMAKRYIEIGGFAEFTTGTYQVAVTRLNWVDADGDGMFDPWEVDMLGSTNYSATGDQDGDGFPNLEEYYLQTDPDDFTSGLLVTRLTAVATGAVVRWQAAENGTYRIWTSTNLVQDVPGWGYVGQKTKSGAPPGWDEMTDATSTNSRLKFYRVEFVY